MSKPSKDKTTKVAKTEKPQLKKKPAKPEVDEDANNTTFNTSKKSSFHQDDSDNDIHDDNDDLDMHDDIYIPAKKSKKTAEKGKATKVQKATEDLKPSNKRKGKQNVDEPEPEPSDEEDEVEDSGSEDEAEDEDDEPKLSKKQLKKKLKAERFNNTDQPAGNSERGIIYVGHLPYGFVEEGLKEYFSQYGEILNINLARSKKTARPKGYAFIEYKNKDVAKIAAENMHGYMIFGKVLQCRLINDDENMKVKTKKFKFIPHAKIFVDNYNKEKDGKKIKKEVKSLLKHEEKKREKLRELGIDYDFPGFKSLVGSA